MQEQVLQKVKQYITETEMIKSQCTVIAGVSGGTGFYGDAGYPSKTSGRL